MRRQQLLALVRARVERFHVDHDPAAVLDPEAVAELTALVETVPDPTADIEIASAAGGCTGTAISSWIPTIMSRTLATR